MQGVGYRPKCVYATLCQFVMRFAQLRQMCLTCESMIVHFKYAYTPARWYTRHIAYTRPTTWYPPEASFTRHDGQDLNWTEIGPCICCYFDFHSTLQMKYEHPFSFSNSN